MTATSRIYAVQSSTGKQLVKATSQAQALRHVARAIYSVTTATALEVADMVMAGHKVQDATAEPEPTQE